MRYFLIPEWSDEMRSKKCKRKNLLGRSDRKKKVALVSGKSSSSFFYLSSHFNFNYFCSFSLCVLSYILLLLTGELEFAANRSTPPSVQDLSSSTC